MATPPPPATLFSALTTDTWLYAHRILSATETRQGRSLARLSSGSRINSAQDDAAGMAIASRLQARNRGMAVDLRNLNDMVSLAQVADGALGSIGENLQRIRELAVQAANGTNTVADRTALDAEANQLIDASRRIQATTEFNGHTLLDGSFQSPAGPDGSVPVSLGSVFSPMTSDVLFHYVQLSQATTTITPTGALADGDLSLNGRPIGATAAGSAPGQGADSAWAIANAINGASTAGVTLTATAQGATLTGSAALINGGSTVGAGDIVINGVPVKAGQVVNAINGITNKTGVSASLVSAGGGLSALVLQAADGRSIDISGAGAFGVGDAHVNGTVTVSGPLAERPKSNLTIGGANPGAAGFTGATIQAVDSGDPVFVPLDEAAGFDQNPNLTTSAGAQATIGVMDRKLTKLLLLRTQVGALLNGLEARADTLSAAQVAGNAAVSRLTDTDYASETAQWARDKLLQEAATAMATQANVESGKVLLLLIDNAASGGTSAKA